VVSSISASITETTDADGLYTTRMDGTITFKLTAEGGDIILDDAGITIDGYALVGNATTTATLVKVGTYNIDGATEAQRTILEGQSKTITASARITGISDASSQYVYFQIATMTWTRDGNAGTMVDVVLEDLVTDSKVFSK